ncbi:sortase domain-containing protein [Nocardioides pyridinolyticus]
MRTLIGLGLALAVALAGSPADAAPVEKGSIEHSAGKPRNARLTILARDIHRLPVVPYRGKTDDAPGTRIQNRGIAAAPYGPNGGTGPGGIGNYQVTGHRTSHGGVFRHTPSLKNGARVFVDAGRYRYVYRIVKTRWVSFRSAKSLRAQRAEVPGQPGKKATRGWITISTCATPEDHARGNYWTDRFGNPEHRIDKVGLLVNRIKNPYWQPQE